MIKRIQKGEETMGKRIITIGRQFGSGGREIGKRLAEKLDIPLYDRELIEKAAEKLNLEVKDLRSADEKLIRNIIFSDYGIANASGSFNYDAYIETLSDKVFKAQSAIIEELANEGPCIFVGRCADYILRDRDDVLRVFICASKEKRLERLQRVRLLMPSEAEKLMKDVDKKRRRHYEAYTWQDWADPENYDMVLNSGILGTDYIIELLAKCLEIEGV